MIFKAGIIVPFARKLRQWLVQQVIKVIQTLIDAGIQGRAFRVQNIPRHTGRGPVQEIVVGFQGLYRIGILIRVIDRCNGNRFFHHCFQLRILVQHPEYLLRDLCMRLPIDRGLRSLIVFRVFRCDRSGAYDKTSQ